MKLLLFAAGIVFGAGLLWLWKWCDDRKRRIRHGSGSASAIFQPRFIPDHMRFTIGVEFYRERQIYYSLFPVIFKPEHCSGLMFEFLRFRLLIYGHKLIVRSQLHRIVAASHLIDMERKAVDNEEDREFLSQIGGALAAYYNKNYQAHPTGGGNES